MTTHRIAAVALTLIACLGGSAAIADWDDVPAKQAAPVPQEQEQEPALPMVKPRYQEPVWQGRRPIPDTKYRLQMVRPQGANVPPDTLVPVIVEDTRGPKPTYGGGFGKVQAAGSTNSTQPSAFSVQPSTVPRSHAGTDPMFQRLGDKGFFGGMRPTGFQVEGSDLKPQLPQAPPEWAKDRLDSTRKFIEGQEHFGNEDPQGFF